MASKHDASAYPAAYAAFLGDPGAHPSTPPRVVIGFTTTEPVPPGAPLADHLRRHGHLATDPLGAAFVLDTFNLSGAWRGTPAGDLTPTFDSLPLVDALLRDSHGVLLWHHQLEALLGLFVRSAGDPATLRKGIAARRAAAFERVRAFELAPGVTLEDVIEERMTFGATVRANLYGARLLLGAEGPSGLASETPS